MKKLLLASAIAGLTISAFADDHKAQNFTTIDENQDGMLGTQEALTAFPGVNFEDSDNDSIVSISEAESAIEGLGLLAMLHDQSQAGQADAEATEDEAVSSQTDQQASNDQNTSLNSDPDTAQGETDHGSMEELTGDSPVRSREYQMIAQHLQDQESMVSDQQNPATAQTSDNN